MEGLPDGFEGLSWPPACFCRLTRRLSANDGVLTRGLLSETSRFADYSSAQVEVDDLHRVRARIRTSDYSGAQAELEAA